MVTRRSTTSRRSADTLMRRLRGHGGDSMWLGPVAMGRGLLLTTGLLTTAAAPLLHLDAQVWTVFALVSAAMVLAVAASFVVDWDKQPATALLVFPLLVFAAFTTLSVGQDGLFAPLSGFFTLCYGYVGLTQKPRRSALLVVPSSVALVSVYGVLNVQIVVRLVVATSVWIILAEVLAGFVVRHDAMAAALRTAAHSDALTGLANRRDLEVRLTTCMPDTTLVVCDLDHFKRINDQHGHSAGDRVLADFGATLRAVLRAGDYCARFGGEEFVMVLPATTPAQSEQVLQRLRLRWSLVQPEVTFSAGIARCDDTDASRALTRADRALYEAKAAGRNRNCRAQAAVS